MRVLALNGHELEVVEDLSMERTHEIQLSSLLEADNFTCPICAAIYKAVTTERARRHRTQLSKQSK
jgi:hypothetical protein